MSVVVTGGRARSQVPAGGAGRLEHALAALAAAEQRTGVQRVRMPRPHPKATHAAVAPRRTVPPLQHDAHLPVHPALAGLLPGGVLPAGGVLSVQGSTSLLLALLGAASQEGAWAVFVGAPAVGMLAAADAGLDLERVALVQDPGGDAPTVVAALLDGVEMVVLGPRATLLDADRRRLAARTRERGAVLVTTSAWPGANVTLDARGGTWSGAEHGAGWLRRRTLSVLRSGRGSAARPLEMDVEVPAVASAWTPPPASEAVGETQLQVVA